MNWSPHVTLNDIPGCLPGDEVSKDIDLSTISHTALQLLKNVNGANVVKDVAWRDWLSLTGTTRTHNGASTVTQVWNKAITVKRVTNFKAGEIIANTSVPGVSWVTVTFTFTAAQEEGLVSSCSGHVALVPSEESRWKIWFIGTMLECFEGYGNPDVPVIDRPSESGIDDEDRDFQVALIGAGQSGLAQAGRLQALGIKYVLLERLPDVGMSWVEKYDTVRQHTLREYNNLPFDRTWNADDDDLLPAARVTEGFQNYAKKYNLNVWCSADVSVRSWDAKQHKWTLDIAFNDGSGRKRTITCHHLGLAIGGGVSQPNRPRYSGEENFKGDFMLMKDFKNSRKWKGQHGVVIGSGTAGHDIAQDMLNNGLSSVTMIQRQKTAIYPIDWLCDGQAVLYNTDVPTDIADRITFMMPQKLGSELMRKSYKEYVAANQADFDAIEEAGFKIDKEAQLMDQIFRRWGGYYINIGTSKRIADGSIKVKSGVAVTKLTEDGIAFTDGTEVKADIVVLAAGYDHDYRKQVAAFVGNDIAEQMEQFWGLTKDGDVQGAMRQQAPGLWLMAGTCMQARFWSRFIALRMQAEFLGKPLVALSTDKVTNGSVNGVH